MNKSEKGNFSTGKSFIFEIAEEELVHMHIETKYYNEQQYHKKNPYFMGKIQLQSRIV